MNTIILQEDPRIVWDASIQTLYSQTPETKIWVEENILSMDSTDETEIISRENKPDLIRIKKQTYTTQTFKLIVERTHSNLHDSSVKSATYILNIV